jgi:hypothetical protein
MSFERMPTAAGGIGAEAAPMPVTEGETGATAHGVPPALKVQILSTEHWGLLASRSMAWNEVFSRAGMFLSALAGAIVALALVAQASSFGREFAIFALVLLPVVLFIGVATVLRLGAANYHDGVCVVGMNRIRHAYLEIAPELEPYLVMSPHDDPAGIARSMGLQPSSSGLVHFISATPTVLGLINSVLGGAIASVAAFVLEADTAVGLGAGLLTFAVTFAAHQVYGRRQMQRAASELVPSFPSSGG